MYQYQKQPTEVLTFASRREEHYRRLGDGQRYVVHLPPPVPKPRLTRWMKRQNARRNGY